MTGWRRAGLIGTVLLGVWSACACGPNFPNGYLYTGNAFWVLEMPQGSFSHELERITGKPLEGADPYDPPWSRPPRGGKWDATLRGDIADLRDALTGREGEDNLNAATSALLGQYEAMREAMKTAADGDEKDTCFLLHRATTPPAADAETEESSFNLDDYANLLKTIPREFVLYVKGAAAYRAKDYETAVKHWEALLDLPADERRFKSTWAAFMLGKAWLRLDPGKAVSCFEKTRKLADQGCRDRLGLAAASEGWQARAEGESGDFAASMHRYLKMRESEDPHEAYIGESSIGWLCDHAFSEHALTPELLTDKLCNDILISYSLSVSASHRPWLRHRLDDCVKQLSQTGVEPPEELCGCLAWAAYRAGQMETARKWAVRAGDTSPYAKWVMAKLALRDGDIAAATDILASLADAFPVGGGWHPHGPSREGVSPRNRVRGDLGTLLLSRNDYVSALDAFLRGRHWLDAAYVAERVLTTAELEEYVSQHADDPELTAPLRQGWGGPTKTLLASVEYLLARRLARDGDCKKAATHMPQCELVMGWRGDTYVASEKLSRFVECLNAGRDGNREAISRGQNLFDAAEIARTFGMELFGTEDEPDWHTFNGSHALRGATVLRIADPVAPPAWVPEAAAAALAPTKEEKARVAEHGVSPEKRFHYRYYAANLMWECAKLCPDNHPLTAKALYRGGTYLKTRDPRAADRFYKALVRRCRGLPIGQEADKLRWFPPNPPP